MTLWCRGSRGRKEQSAMSLAHLAFLCAIRKKKNASLSPSNASLVQSPLQGAILWGGCGKSSMFQNKRRLLLAFEICVPGASTAFRAPAFCVPRLKQRTLKAGKSSSQVLLLRGGLFLSLVWEAFISSLCCRYCPQGSSRIHQEVSVQTKATEHHGSKLY